MACSKYEYVKTFEQPDTLLPSTWIVVRLDGRSFHAFTAAHGYTKPNDVAGLSLMNTAAQVVMASFPDIVLAFGASDEYSFLLPPGSRLFRRRASKLVSVLTSTFTAAFVMGWPAAMDDDRPLRLAPVFDGRAVVYPTARTVRDYFAWRQADVHVNNTYNSAFWALVERGGVVPAAAERALAGTDVAAKNELLWSRFGINYNEQPPMFRKGSTLLRVPVSTTKAGVGAGAAATAATGAGEGKQPVRAGDGCVDGDPAALVANGAPPVAAGEQQPLTVDAGRDEQLPAAKAAGGDRPLAIVARGADSPVADAAGGDVPPADDAREQTPIPATAATPARTSTSSPAPDGATLDSPLGNPTPPPRHRAARRARAAARRTRSVVVVSHGDLIGDAFWVAHPHLLERGER